MHNSVRESQGTTLGGGKLREERARKKNAPLIGNRNRGWQFEGEGRLP